METQGTLRRWLLPDLHRTEGPRHVVLAITALGLLLGLTVIWGCHAEGSSTLQGYGSPAAEHSSYIQEAPNEATPSEGFDDGVEFFPPT